MLPWLVALVALQAADVVLTLHGLALGAQEVNPLMSVMFEHSPAAAVFVKGLGVAACIGIFWGHRASGAAREGLRACVVVSAAVVAFNLGVVLSV